MATARNIRIRWTVSFLITLGVLGVPAQAQYGGGSGTADDPYQIWSPEQMNALGAEPNDWDQHFKLMADVDLAGTQYSKAVIAWDSDDIDFGFGGTPFTGAFDGGGHEVANLAIDAGSPEEGRDFLGLFGVVSTGAVIQDLGVVNAAINGGGNSDYIGCLAGAAFDATIEGCSATGTIASQFNSQALGGLVGMADDSAVRHSHAACTVAASNGSSSIGGVVGSLRGGSVSDCTSSGSISGGTLSTSVGGVIGSAIEVTIAGCSSSSVVSGDVGSGYVGGLIGSGQRVTIRDCGSTATVSGGPISYALGGLAGLLNGSFVERCCSDATVEGNSETYDVGGLIGQSRETSVIKCCSMGPVSGGVNSDYLGGLVGNYRATFNLSFDGSHVIVDCNSSSTVTGRENSDHVGGLVGSHAWGGTIYNCYATGAVHGEEEVAGLVGWNAGDIANSYATGDVTSVYDADRLGGLVGRNEGLIVACYASGSITGGYNSDHLGGLVGRNSDDIIDCYATGSVSGGLDADDVGGLVGLNATGGSLIRDCYSTGKVSSLSNSESIGGFVGNQENGYVTDCFWDMEASERTKGAGVIGDRSDGVILSGLTTEQMGDVTHFMSFGWGFVGDTTPGVAQNWIMVEGAGRPALRWQHESEIELPTFSGGSGTPAAPYLIAGPDDLRNVAYSPELLDKHFKLVADIDMDGADPMPIIGKRPAPFSGVFDGDSHRIYNLTKLLTTDFDHHVGMFGCLGEGALVKDLDLSIQIPDQTRRSLGGLVGYVDRGTITNCRVSGSVAGENHVGGLVGYNHHGAITNCSAAAEVIGRDNVGGLAGSNGGTLVNCYSTGLTNGHFWVGGLVGAHTGTLTYCYSAGAVSGDDLLGGLIGRYAGGTVLRCFWDTEASGQIHSPRCTGKTTAEMQTASTFLDAGWDFVDETANGTDDIWWILEGQDYPRLWWE